MLCSRRKPCDPPKSSTHPLHSLTLNNDWSLSNTDLETSTFCFDRTHLELNLLWLHFHTELPGSLLVKRVGPKYLFGVPMFITSVFTILTPAAAHHSVEMLILVRILQGLVMVSFLINICFFSLLFYVKNVMIYYRNLVKDFQSRDTGLSLGVFPPAAVIQVRLPQLASY